MLDTARVMPPAVAAVREDAGMLSAAIETCLRSAPNDGAPRPAPAPAVTLDSGRTGRVAVVRVPADWDGADDSGLWVLLERAMRARVRLVILDLSAGRHDHNHDGGHRDRTHRDGVDRLVGRLNRHRIRYAVVAAGGHDETAGLGAAGPVYSTIAIARGTAGVLRTLAVP